MAKDKEKRDLQTVTTELKALQDEYRGKPMPEDVAGQFSALAQEAKAMQDEVERDQLIRDAQIADQKAQEISRDLTPASNGGPAADEAKGERPVGYLTLGDMVIASDGFRSYTDAGMPKAQMEWLKVNASAIKRSAKSTLVPVTKSQIQALAQKAVPDIGERVVPFDRDPDLVLDAERRELRIVDVLNVTPTDANVVEWVKRTSYTPGAATQTETTGGSTPAKKGEASKKYELATTPIRTHAVWMPVTEQQLADWPQMSSLVNVDLMQDLAVYRENQLTYGDGDGTNFEGLLVNEDIGLARVEADDTLIDQIRRGVTDIRRAHLIPNAVLIDPLDWEAIVLEKGTDDRYVWVVVTEGGQNRLWALPIVETVAMENPDTGERNVLIGDYQRGATLYDRQQTTVSSGWIDDQFVRNMRTVLVESRSGFAVRRPQAFRKIMTNAYS